MKPSSFKGLGQGGKQQWLSEQTWRNKTTDQHGTSRSSSPWPALAMPWEWETFGDFLIFATGVEEVRSKAGISFTLSWSQISIVISIDVHTCLVFCLRMYKSVQFLSFDIMYYVTAKNLLLLYHCKIMSRKELMTPHLLIGMGYDIGTK